jgi:GNAT superfamily N-acetyltransferase
MKIQVRPLRERDLEDADRIFRLAFGTFLRLPDPLAFAGDSDYVRTRFRATPQGAFAAEVDGELVGSNFATRWGTFGFFGPLTVRPDLWDRGIARRLLEPTMAVFDEWRTTHRGLFTFSHSGKHHALYQKFGFYPRFLTSVLGKAVSSGATSAAHEVNRLSELSESERQSALRDCLSISDSLYPGLDLTSEIRTISAARLGDTVLWSTRGRVNGFAACHVGKGTEAGSGNCYVKFGAVRPGDGAERAFAALLDACEAFAAASRAKHLVVGVNLAREGAYREILRRGFRADLVGVAMQSGNEPGYNTPQVWAIDDWR